MSANDQNIESTEITPQKMKLSDLAPSEWLRNGFGDRVVARCYRVMRADEALLKQQVVLLNVPNARVIFFYGHPDYYNAGDVRVVLDDAGIANIEVRNVGLVQCPPDSYMMILAPFRDGDRASQFLAGRHIDQAAGLVSAFMGHNCIYSAVFENLASLKTDETSASTPVIRNPWSCRAPALTGDSLTAVANAARAIEGLPGGKRDRTKRSLRWFADALQSDGADAFLKLWTATEMIAMPNSGKIDLLCRIVGDVYAMREDNARRAYKLGKLYDIRNAIVHAGKYEDLGYPIVAYLESVYVDVALQTLGQPSLKRAAEALTSNGPELEETLSKL
jgi:hypothetical protein